MSIFAHAPVLSTTAAAGETLHTALFAEARAVLAEVMHVPSDALDVALAVHRAAGDDVSDETLAVLSVVLAW